MKLDDESRKNCTLKVKVELYKVQERWAMICKKTHYLIGVFDISKAKNKKDNREYI